jgi:hypothetical protein
MKLENPLQNEPATSNRPTIMGTKHVIAAGHYLAAHAVFRYSKRAVMRSTQA